MPIDEFDYSDAAIVSRALARLPEADHSHELALDALWRETRQRALFLYFGVCCRLNATRVRSVLANLDAAMAREPGFRSTAETPTPEIEATLSELLALLGLDQMPLAGAGAVADASADGAVRPRPVPEKQIYDSHVVTEDMRWSRFAGTGRAGEFLSPFEDAIRRFTTLLSGGSFLNKHCNDGMPVFVSKSFGRPELIATHAYVDYCLEQKA